MNMFLYVIAALIWGSTPFCVKLQLSMGPLFFSVALRFLIASALLFLYCIITKKRLCFSGIDHIFMALQGFSLFFMSYSLAYMAISYIASGLVAVILSSLLMFNILNLKIFMKKKIEWRALAGGFVGIAGISLIFLPQINVSSNRLWLIGLCLAFLATYFNSIGDIVGARNAKSSLPVTQANAYAMGYGSIFTFILCFVTGENIINSISFNYMAMTFYLSVFSSVLGVGCYMLLLGRIGPDYSAYITIFGTIIALVISTIFEGYIWTPASVSGVGMIISGNIIMLLPSRIISAFWGKITSKSMAPIEVKKLIN